MALAGTNLGIIVQQVEKLGVGCCYLRGVKCCKSSKCKCYRPARISTYDRDDKAIKAFVSFANGRLSKEIGEKKAKPNDELKNIFEFFHDYREMMRNNIGSYYEEFKIEDDDTKKMIKKSSKVLTKAFKKLSKNPCNDITSIAEFKDVHGQVDTRYSDFSVTSQSITNPRPFKVKKLYAIEENKQIILNDSENTTKNNPPAVFKNDEYEYFKFTMYSTNKYQRENLKDGDITSCKDTAIELKEDEVRMLVDACDYSRKYDVSVDIALLHTKKKTIQQWYEIFWYMQMSSYARFAKYNEIPISMVSQKEQKEKCARSMIVICLLFTILLSLVLPLIYIAKK